jgi:hypothetical protein
MLDYMQIHTRRKSFASQKRISKYYFGNVSDFQSNGDIGSGN